MPQQASATELADRLHSSAIHLLRWLSEVDHESPVTRTQLSALSVIVFKGPLSLKALARAENVKPPSMSRLVRALESKGLAEQAVAPDDRRSIRIQATVSGRNVLNAGRRRRVQRLAQRLRELPVEAHEALVEAIVTLEALAPRS